MITIPVLQALLSANGRHRQATEQVLHKPSVKERLTCFTPSSSAAATAAGNNAVLLQLVAVLLRCDVLKCTNADLLQQLVMPLIFQAFSDHKQQQPTTTTTTTTTIGNVLATIRDMLNVLKEHDAAVTAMRQILGHAGVAERAGNGQLARLLLWVAELLPVLL
jgi:hypothetical protein